MRKEIKTVFITKENDCENANELVFFNEENCRHYEELTNPAPEIRSGLGVIQYEDDKFERLDPFCMAEIHSYNKKAIVVKTEEAKQYLLQLAYVYRSGIFNQDDDYPLMSNIVEELNDLYHWFKCLEYRQECDKKYELPVILVPDTEKYQFFYDDSRRNMNMLWREVFTLPEFREVAEKNPEDDKIREFARLVEETLI